MVTDAMKSMKSQKAGFSPRPVVVLAGTVSARLPLPISRGLSMKTVLSGFSSSVNVGVGGGDFAPLATVTIVQQCVVRIVLKAIAMQLVCD
mmetsp:Transcript_26371/g.56644  ORF Transcript_26371/g.56644 Transcript_26371/m.56644 type:complete len:91 (-) Transcript_26371:3-275(-)